MKKVIRRVVLILSFVMICYVSYGALGVSAAEDFNDMGSRAISNINKVWTLKFKKPVDVSSLNNNVSMQDLTDGSIFNVSISSGDDENSVKINPPSGGYKMSHSYKLIMSKNIKSKKGNSLPKSAVLKFNLTSKNNNSYNISANIVVSQFLPAFKQINISTNLPSASKYKIEGNNNFISFGKDIPSLVAGSTATISLYDNKENLLGTSILDVSSTKNNVSTNITLAD